MNVAPDAERRSLGGAAVLACALKVVLPDEQPAQSGDHPPNSPSEDEDVPDNFSSVETVWGEVAGKFPGNWAEEATIICPARRRAGLEKSLGSTGLAAENNRVRL